jgi:hypothetical protein
MTEMKKNNSARKKEAKLLQFQLYLYQFLYRLQVGYFSHFGGDRPQRAPALGMEERILQLGAQGAGADGGFGIGGEIERDLEELVPDGDPAYGFGLVRHLAKPGLAVVVVAPIDRHLRIIAFQQQHESVPGGLGAAKRLGEDAVGRINIGVVQERMKHGGTLIIIIQVNGRKSNMVKEKKARGKRLWVIGYGCWVKGAG